MFEIDSSDRASTVIRIHGDVDVQSCDAFRGAVRRASDTCSERVVIALDACGLFDCSGIGVLVGLRRELGPRLKVFVPSRHMSYRVFDMLGLLESLEVVTTLEEALQRPVIAA